MGKKKTPLIQKLRSGDTFSGGTMYVFPSANEDIGLNLNSDVNGVALSHYALLDIPEMSAKKLLVGNDQLVDGGKVTTGAHALALSLQNYMMNMETLLVNQESYNYQEMQTVTEKVFWHWAMKVGMLDGGDLTAMDGFASTYYESAYDESSYVSDGTLVKCFGAIDAGNKLSTEFGMFNETYINIPTSYGAGPVFFRCSEDSNFKYQYYPLSNRTKLEGRNDGYEYTSYLGYDQPFYDHMDPVTKKARYVTSASKFEGMEIVKDLSAIESLMRARFGDDTISVTSYDDVNVDIDDKFGADRDFEFNAILLYYSVYDQNDQVKTAYATNLFGIVFLDAPKETAADGGGDVTFYIPRQRKAKSTEERFGNSYSFRVNIKTMSVYDNTDAVIQDNTTMSSVAAADFSDAISQLNRAVDIMNTNAQTTARIQDSYSKIVTFYDNQEQKIERLDEMFNAYIKGDRTAIIDTSLVYANTMKPSEANADNNIVFNVRDSVDEFGNITYKAAPPMVIDSSGVHTTNLDTTSLYHNDDNGFVKLQNTTVLDTNVLDSALYGEGHEDTLNAINILDEMFNSSTNLVVKVKYDTDYSIDNATHHDKVYNQLYLDSDSMVYDMNTYDRTGFLKDADENLNYTGLIPYLVAQLQRVTMNQNYVYDPNNDIVDISQVDSMKDALDYIINNMLGNSMGKVITTFKELTDRYTIYNGEDAELTLVWTACDQNDYIKDVLINTDEMQMILNGNPQDGYDIKMKQDENGHTVYECAVPVTVTEDKKFTLSASSSFVNSMGLSPAVSVQNLTITMVNKCYYWNAVEPKKGGGCFGEGDDCENAVSAADVVLSYMDTSGKTITLKELSESASAKAFKNIAFFDDSRQHEIEKTCDEEAYYYFLVPKDQYERYMFISVGEEIMFSSTKLGTGISQVKLKEGGIKLKEYDKAVEYFLYRSDFTQDESCHIKIV